ncbi:hypothetical protein JL720_2469 [Aureococcus anophagefferens]|nr:hypothetical protein JL720_2469 [Aureococcus anophagefferens]
MDASWFWVPDDAEGFVAARLVSRNKRDNLVCVSRDGRTLDPAPASACYAIDDVASVDEPPPCDLVLLAEVSPASILHALRRRFEDDDIYTSLGSVLAALNPLKAIDGLYGPAALAHYGGGAGGALAPHVYDVAAAAYRGVRGGDAGSARSQSLVISGESGAGKTETTKHALAYLAFVAGSPGGVQERILAASPILEALGNAKTSRNDNSSRLCGSQIFNPTSMCAYATRAAIDREVFFYCGLPGDGRGGFDVAGADDAAAFVETDGPEDGSAADAPGRDALERGRASARTRRAATLRTAEVKTGRRCSVTKVPLPPPQAAVARDAFARQRYAVPETTGGTPRPAKTSRARLYGALFEWTVGRVNESVGGGGAASSGPVVGVLDIFGFEIFTVNSFEQLLINFANEGLQRLFNRTVFDEEMALYEAEGVGQCVRLDYVDNADVLALLGGRRPPGVVEMLDEESKLPRGSSANFRARLAKRHAGHARFSTPRSASTAFFVEHYAGKVCYEAASFVEKNRDGVTGDMVAAFGDCTLPLVAACFAGRGAASKASVGAKFKKSLDALTATLGATEPHYVRCVKSNPRKAPGTMDYKLCLEQLTYAGVLEAVKIHQRASLPPGPRRVPPVLPRRRRASGGPRARRTGRLFAGPPRAQCEALAAALAARDDAWPSGDLGAGPGDSANYGRAVAARDAVARVADVKRSLDLGLRDRDEDRLTAALGALDELRSDGKLAAGLWADDEARARARGDRRAAAGARRRVSIRVRVRRRRRAGVGRQSADEAARTRALSKKTRDARAAARTLLELRDFDARGAWDDAARLAGDDGAWAVGAWAAAVEGERAPRARCDGAVRDALLAGLREGRIVGPPPCTAPVGVDALEAALAAPRADEAPESSTSSTSRASRPRSRTRRARSPPPRDEVAAATVEAHYRAARKALALAPMDGRPDAVAAFDPNAGSTATVGRLRRLRARDRWPLNDALAACDDRERKTRRAAGAFEADHGALSPSARHLADDAARLLELRAAIRESRWEADPRCPWRGAPKADILRAVLAGRDGLAGCFAALERAPPRALAIGGDE